MQTSSLHSMAHPHLIYMGAITSPRVSLVLHYWMENKNRTDEVSELKIIKHVIFPLVISVACEKD